MTVKELIKKLQEFPEDIRIDWGINRLRLYDPKFKIAENLYKDSDYKELDITFDDIDVEFDSLIIECPSCGIDI